mgnify:CR=1 FL=1
MYIDKDDFTAWMERIMDRFDMQDKKIDRVIKGRNCLDGEELLDNQDLCLLFKVSTRTLQRLRSKKLLPFMMISGKAYYRASDVREFIKERFDVGTFRKFEKEYGTDK